MKRDSPHLVFVMKVFRQEKHSAAGTFSNLMERDFKKEGGTLSVFNMEMI